MDTSKEDNSFICPNCGSNVSTGTIHISQDDCPDDPWSSILQVDNCALCRHTIPAHLGERWDNRSIEEARKEWLGVYKEKTHNGSGGSGVRSLIYDS